MKDETLNFDYQKETPKLIKVVGVGGGGGNAVTHMYKEGIHDVSFVLCNTDIQALDNSEVRSKLVLGHTITQGLGAGSKPEKARMAAEESRNDIQTMLSDGTKMVFITAGMGGGTGTGAAPVIAKISKEMGVLTVGIVTIPFHFEGEDKIIQALEGVERMSENVDALLVINNESLSKLYPELDFLNAFKKADDTLTTAAKSIAEIITIRGYINLDFADVETTVKDGGVALMSNGFGEGENRLNIALEDAIVSPLLNNSNVFKARNVLLNISFSSGSQVRMEEVKAINAFMARFDRKPKVIWGAAFDDSLGDQIKVTLLVTGFGVDDIPQIAEKHAQMMTEEEFERLDAEAKEGARRKKLIDKYYGETSQATTAPQKKYVILTEKELDDDLFITLLEENATFTRDMRKVIQFRNKTLLVSSPTSGGQQASSMSMQQQSRLASNNGMVRVTPVTPPPMNAQRNSSSFTPRNKGGGGRFD